jgi:negative regulator of sigma E activity
LLDGEVGAGELDRIMQDLSQSPRLWASWDRQCRARAAVEGVDVARHVDICSGVMAAVASMAAPQPVAAAQPALPPPRQAERLAVGTQRRRSAWRRRAYGLAAASMAAVAVLTTVRVREEPEAGAALMTASAPMAAPTAAPQLVAAHMPASALPTMAASSVSTALDVGADDGNDSPAVLDADSQQMLDDLLIEHGNYRMVQMGGSLSYARFAANTAVFRPNSGQR